MPLLSVLLPVRDEAPYLAEALASLSAQTFGDFEVLVVDDGSRDSWSRSRRRTRDDDARFRVLTSSQSPDLFQQ